MRVAQSDNPPMSESRGVLPKTRDYRTIPALTSQADIHHKRLWSNNPGSAGSKELFVAGARTDGWSRIYLLEQSRTR
jgi:hypothetical protein